MVNSLSIDDWFQYIHDNNFLVSLDEIINLNAGESIEVLFIDRNFLEFCPEGYNINIFQNLERYYRGRYTKHNNESLKGTFEWYSMEGMDSHITQDFEFDCKEAGTNMYWPLNEDRLNFLADHWRFYQGEPDDLGTMEDLYQRFLNECRHYTEINRNSLVGWRGPMIRLDKVALLPNLNNSSEN